MELNDYLFKTVFKEMGIVIWRRSLDSEWNMYRYSVDNCHLIRCGTMELLPNGVLMIWPWLIDPWKQLRISVANPQFIEIISEYVAKWRDA